MPAYNFPATSEVTTLEGTTISTTVSNGYNFITNEKPVPSAKFRGWLKAVQDLFTYVKSDLESPISPTLVAGWVNFPGFQPTRYWKDKNNMVHITGLPQRTSGSSTVIFTLPLDYRPASEQLFKMVMFSGTAYAICDARVLTNGNIQINGGTFTTTANFVPLGGIYFRTV